MGRENVEMEIGEEEVRDMIVRFCLLYDSIHVLSLGPFPSPRRRPTLGQDARSRSGNRRWRYEKVIESQIRTLLARPSARLRRI
jgi:hypothetical protein